VLLIWDILKKEKFRGGRKAARKGGGGAQTVD